MMTKIYSDKVFRYEAKLEIYNSWVNITNKFEIKKIIIVMNVKNSLCTNVKLQE